ncbi:hypothetical protein NQ317_007186 [Molorchus minor]|uniref:Uncharacterized protein n=1 Tax=Molorchus minor TaxID=1323400 RepID=A0ABQ9J6M8_9CUCU|nr:hypothetical protein NQ317_007186 [Molorchus minor]
MDGKESDIRQCLNRSYLTKSKKELRVHGDCKPEFCIVNYSSSNVRHSCLVVETASQAVISVLNSLSLKIECKTFKKQCLKIAIEMVLTPFILYRKWTCHEQRRIIKLALKKQDVSISKNSEDNSNNLLNEALLHDVVILIIGG